MVQKNGSQHVVEMSNEDINSLVLVLIDYF